mgnify:CR=1 FL=1
MREFVRADLALNQPEQARRTAELGAVAIDPELLHAGYGAFSAASYTIERADREAVPAWRRVVAEQPAELGLRLELARAREGTARALWKDAAVWEVIPVAQAGAWAPITETGWLIRDTLSARMSPRRAVASLFPVVHVVVPEAAARRATRRSARLAEA